MKIVNTRGFTLVELMSVIIILGIICLIVFPTAISSINNSKEKLYKEQVNRILDAAKDWATSHASELPNDRPTEITIDNLQKAGFLKKETIKNPLKNETTMNSKIMIYFDINYNQYSYVYCDLEYGSYYYDDMSILDICR